MPCRFYVVIACMLVFVSAVNAADTWHGYDKLPVTVDGRAGYVVKPKHAAEGKPWVWRARFPDYHPEIDLLLLERGFHIAFTNTNDMLGSDAAIKHWDKFYKVMTTEFGLSKIPALEAVSRGGLFVYRWAAANADKVACIYADTPVCDFKSWPLGKGKGIGSKSTWQRLLKEYGLTEEQALAYDRNPIDVLEPIARAGVPILHIVSESDTVVPPDENTYLLQKRYHKFGGAMRVMSVAEGTAQSHGHHFTHPDPQTPADFIVRYTIGSHDWFTLRDGLQNARIRFERDKIGRVVFLGGSITYNPGWQNMVAEELKRRFPQTQFDFINAGIPSTGSVPGAFRFERDVLDKGPVDLLFEEAAVNDSANTRTAEQMVRGMEGIVRHALLANPNMEVVVMHFVDPWKMADYNKGQTPTVVAIHEKVAAHYNVASINLALEVTQRINAGQFTWKDDFKNLHPSPFGQKLYFNTIKRMFDQAWAAPLKDDAKLTPHRLPEPLDAHNYSGGKLVDVKQAKLGDGFAYDSNWKPARSRTRPGFVNVPMVVAQTPGASLTFDFQGTAVGIFVAAGYDTGVIEYRIDDGPWQKRDLFTRWSGGLHIPWAYVLSDELKPGKHTLTLRMTEEKNKNSQGHACRIAHFLVNESVE